MAGKTTYFKAPPVIDNFGGWGPGDAAAVLDSHVFNVPYTPFSKGEKLGRFADPGRASHILDEQESVFTPVDGKPPPRRNNFPNRRNNAPQLPQRIDEEVEAKKREAERDKIRREKQYIQISMKQRRQSAALKSSVEIQADWSVRETILFSTFAKLSFNVSEPEDLAMCGSLQYYDKAYDRVTPRNERRLDRFKDYHFFKITTSDDPVIRRLASEDKATVFATDTILSTLMCASRSVYSWDIVVQRVGNKLFFDKRDNSQLDFLSVHETAQEAVLSDVKEDINSAHSLSFEAATINQNFSQQILARNGKKVEFAEPNPFAGETTEKVASVGYRYRRWKLDDETHLVVRCELHGVMTDARGGTSFLTVNALNEFDPKLTGMDWRQKLETQRGAVLATELKNNGNKLAKWTAQALLSNADMMKLGFVSRIHPKDHYNHVVLGVQGYKPKDFATQINLNTNNMWGIVKSIVDLCMKLPEGKYLFVKDPQKQQVRLYEVPGDAFENDYADEPLAEEEQVLPAEPVVATTEKPSEVDADV